ncbi:MAG: hypothetical protein ACREJD_09395 [Phycisphaerales bacterium]
MAGLKVAVVTAAVAITNADKTVVMVTAGAAAGARLNNFSIAFNGTSPTEGKVTVEIVRKFTAGTGTAGSSVTPRKISGHAGAVQLTASQNYSAEPTTGASYVAWSTLVHPQGNYQVPMDILVDPGETIAVRCNSPTAKSVVTALQFDE